MAVCSYSEAVRVEAKAEKQMLTWASEKPGLEAWVKSPVVAYRWKASLVRVAGDLVEETLGSRRAEEDTTRSSWAGIDVRMI